MDIRHFWLLLATVLLASFGLAWGIDDIRITLKQKETKYKIDLPEEITIAKKGDTLIINKITEDSIYLGFNKFKR